MSGIEPDRRRWRKKGRRNGAAVKVSCRTRHKETLGTARGPRSGSSPSAYMESYENKIPDEFMEKKPEMGGVSAVRINL